jgi:hypothetical protein
LREPRGEIVTSWHRSGCKVSPDDIGKIRLVQVVALDTGERRLQYECTECGGTHVIIAGRAKPA